MVRSGAVGPYGGATYQDGIHLNFASGNTTSGYYVKAVGAAPTVSPLTSLFTFTGGNQSMYMGPAGLLVASATNTPRIEYDASGNCLGLLMEAARTNLCLQSQTFGTTWTTSSSSVSSDAVAAPDGTTTADKIVEAAATARHFVTQSITKAAANVTYAVSVWFKSAERTFGSIRVSDGPQAGDARVNINLTTGVAGSVVLSGVGFSSASSSVTAGANGWYRLTLIFTSSADTTLRVEPGVDTDNDATALSYTGDGTSGLLVWGAQVEAAAFSSSYIPTTTVSVARTADSCIRTLGSEFSATAGTVVVAGRASGGQDAATAQTTWSLDDGVGNEIYRLIRPAASDLARFSLIDGGVPQATLDFTAINSTNFKHASAWAVNDIAATLNAATVLTDAVATLATPTSLNLGTTVGGGLVGNCHILRFDYWPERKANAFLVSAST